jgi:sugar phosphate isomerase/epimerase
MKLAFSTLACPDWTWGEIQATAVDLGYDGIELRGLNREYFLPDSPLFSAENLELTKKHLEKLRIQISSLTTGSLLQIEDQEKREGYIKEAIAYIKLAAALGVKYVRVLGDIHPEPGVEVQDQLVRDALVELGDCAIDHRVYVLIETNGAYTDSRRLSRLLEEVSHPAVGVLWDCHHTYRFGKESFQETWGILKEHIKYLHLKDSVVEDGKIRYRLFGEGDLPLTELLMILQEEYQGWLSLEWVKAWEPELEEPSLAIPHFIDAFHRLQRKVKR